MRKKILVCGAHPDDVEIGMGGSIRRLTEAGNEVYVCIAIVPDNEDTRWQEAVEAAEILGVKEIILLPINIAQFGHNRVSIGAVDEVISRINPSAVFTHWLHDSHQDHVNFTRCVISATRRNNFHVLMYENTIPGGVTPMAFRAQYFIDISSTIEAKLDSVRAHISQISRNGNWWIQGVKGRAMYRGYQIHANYAEAFEVVKINNDINFFNNTNHT